MRKIQDATVIYMLNYAIIGFGGLGHVHFNQTKLVADSVGDIQLTAICDANETRCKLPTATNLNTGDTGLDVSAYRFYSDVNALFANEKLDFVITALPTYLHEKIAVMAMEHGLHVFSEKPMALNCEQAENMIAKAKENHVKLMIGHCLRFWPEYEYLKTIIDNRKYGRVIRAELTRQCATPIWSWNRWMEDASKSGGAILDLHIHDADFILWAFGMPTAVTSSATSCRTGYDSVFTIYHYDDGKTVTAAADWGHPQGYPFSAEYSVRFEHATVTYKNGILQLYPEDGTTETIACDSTYNAYAREMIAFINCIKQDKPMTINPPEDSLLSVKLIEAERLSADTGTTVAI